MNKYVSISVILSSFMLLSACNNYRAVPFWELPDPNLDEIAMIRADPDWGTAVIYNPVTCEKIGNACGFFRLQAFSHEQLNHGLLGEPDDYPQSQRNEADCWSAKYGKPEDVYAAYKLMMNKDRDPSLKIHGQPEERARLIKECAQSNNNWAG